MNTIASMEVRMREARFGLPSVSVQGLDAFAPITDAEREGNDSARKVAGGAAGEDAIELLPLMHDPAPGAFRHREHGEPKTVWLYRDHAGAVIAAAARYQWTNPDHTIDKVVLPWCHGKRTRRMTDGRTSVKSGWHAKAMPEPRSLYGLHDLTCRHDAPVLVTEGEKAANAAADLFPDYVAVTSAGGSKAALKTDWSMLAGRDVVIWPDNDEAGRGYAADVEKLAREAGAESVRVVEVPQHWPAGCDLADDFPEDLTKDGLIAMVEGAPVGAGVKLPSSFRMTRDGLFYDPQATEKNPDPAAVFIAAPFEVVGETRDDTGQSWGLLLRWKDSDGRSHAWAIPRRLTHRPGHEIAEALEDGGLNCGVSPMAHEQLKRFIASVKTDRRIQAVNRAGWHQGEDGSPIYVLPDGETIGRGGSSIVLQSETPASSAACREKGSLDGWKSTVATLAVGNDRLAVAIAMSFAAGLLDVTGDPSGGLHILGSSRSGKSTAAIAAASVWGEPSSKGRLGTWRGTANGLEATAAEASGSLLVLDEMGQADAKEVADVVYMLGNEAGKSRASRTGAARRRQSWQLLFLSTGEVSLSQKLGEVGKKAMAGLEARLVNMPADAGAGMGVFQQLHGHGSPAELAEAIKAGAMAHHGAAARAFLRRLAEDRASDDQAVRAAVQESVTAFLLGHLPADASGQVRTGAQRFGLAAAAGEMAVSYGVLPWPAGEATRAAAACLRAWIKQRGGSGAAEEGDGLRQVRAFLEAHGESRFTRLSDLNGDEPEPADGRVTVNRAGWRRPAKDGWEYLILPEAWKSEV